MNKKRNGKKRIITDSAVMFAGLTGLLALSMKIMVNASPQNCKLEERLAV